MDDATQIPVIINSVVLVIFLIAAIALVVQALKLVKRVKALVEKAEDVASAVESASDAIRQSMAPVGLGRHLSKFAKGYMRKKKERLAIMKRLIERLAAAAFIGYIAGLLTAPKSGKQTREDIKEVTHNSYSETEKQLKRAHTELNGLIAMVTDRSSSMSSKAKTQADEVVATATNVKSKTAIAISALRDGEAKDKDLRKAIKDAQKAVEHLKDYLKK